MANTRHDLGRAQRFREFRKKYVANGMQNAENLLTIGKSRISRIEKGEEPIPVVIIDLLVNKFDLNRDWLLENKGNPIKKDLAKKTGLESTILMGNRIDKLTNEVLILNKNLDRAWNVIERLEREIENLKK